MLAFFPGLSKAEVESWTEAERWAWCREKDRILSERRLYRILDANIAAAPKGNESFLRALARDAFVYEPEKAARIDYAASMIE